MQFNRRELLGLFFSFIDAAIPRTVNLPTSSSSNVTPAATATMCPKRVLNLQANSRATGVGTTASTLSNTTASATGTVRPKRVLNRRVNQGVVTTASTASSNKTASATAIVRTKRILSRRTTQQELLNYKKVKCVFCNSSFISATNQVVCDRCLRYE